jgi:hypothetical protein
VKQHQGSDDIGSAPTWEASTAVPADTLAARPSVVAEPPKAPAHVLQAEAISRFDPPYHLLEPLPRSVWLPVLITAAGTRENRLAHGRQWLEALNSGLLPEALAHFGESDACAALRATVGELQLPALARGVPTLAEQVLRTLLWHLDRIPDLQPRLSRAQAVAQAVAEFRDAWRIDTAGLEDELALLRDLADGAHLRWDALRGQLRSREWQAARQAADRLAELPAVVALLDRLGRSAARPSAPQRRAPQPRDTPQRDPHPRRAG